ncbi:MAG: hypothetical protein DRQ56_09285 [Gammaproteobacteria bacterium]|nr:MAG: hypothetical protein DRQ56_09285 [Gammaproteobacteria bacterium]
MEQNTYKMLRAFCVQDIGEHIPKLAEIENNPSLAKKFDVEKLSSSEVALALDNAVAHDLLGLSGDSIRMHQSDLTPRQLAAAKLLKVRSGARLIAINHEKFGIDNSAEEQAQKASDAVRKAAKVFSSFLPKKDSAALMSLAPKRTSEAGAPKTKKTGKKSPAPVVEHIEVSTPTNWKLTKPQRFQGYTEPLYDLLSAAWQAGRECPSAADVLKEWKANPPLGYGIEVAGNLRQLTYHGSGKQPIKPADSEAITKTIRRMTEDRSRR